jgi:hypothetical protein
MSVDPAWYQDPFGRADQRYHDGNQWTEHVLIGGQQGLDPPDALPPPPVGAQPPPPNEQAPKAGKFRQAIGAIKSAAASGWPASASGSASPPEVESGPATSRHQQPSSTKVLWEGQRESLTATASKGRLVSARYQVTEDAIRFEAGLVSTKAEIVPLWTVVDVDLAQSITQKARGVGDVTVHLEEAVASRFGQDKVVLESIKDPRAVRDLIAARANDLRMQFAEREHRLEVEKRTAAAGSINVGVSTLQPLPQSVPSAPVESAAPHANQVLIDQLRQLGELRDAGVLSEEEFQEQKARMLHGS